MRDPIDAFGDVVEALESADLSVERLKCAITMLLPAGYSVVIEEQGTLFPSRYKQKFRNPLRSLRAWGITIRYGDWSRWFPSISELLERAEIGIGGRLAGWDARWPTEKEVPVRRTQEDCRKAGLRFRYSGTPGLQFVAREDLVADSGRSVLNSNVQDEVVPLADDALVKEPSL